ncbi:uncharacterized protein FTOL_08579 [Fusarium torulosum]|uniref:AB hydrolase-1 domain-containing protein n=1 Tax=Fusarium torulosum TaxID=33205 RepID=A0AAE8MED1_9HYPO|nr:uncharacterized protein FTOL_08579 [Fusarium torulosum]
MTQTPHILGAPSQEGLRQTDGCAESRPYSPTSLPGGRKVKSPYGAIRVYEWGPERGHKVLLLCGVSTPAVVLSDLADALVEKGSADYFGRGYSDALIHIRHDAAFYVVQIPLVLSSSEISWMGTKSFSVIGYSFGGALAMALAEHLPNLIRSITLVAPSGLMRKHHVGWQARPVYHNRWLHASLRRALVRRRLYIPPPLTSQPNQDTATSPVGSSDATGGPSYDYAVISKTKPGVTVADVLNWQLANHSGFVDSFVSCINYAPTFEQTDSWTLVDQNLSERRRVNPNDIAGARILLILGASDPGIVKEELVLDDTSVLGDDGFKLVVLNDDMEIRAEMMAAQNAAAKNNIVSFEAQLPNISDFKSDIEAAKTTAQSS